MKKTVYIPEILAMVSKASKKQDKIEILQRFADVKGFKHVLFLTYDPTLEWVITRSDIENLRFDHMDIADYDLAVSNLFLEAPRRLFNFTNFRKPILPKDKVIRLVRNMFSVFHPEEIEIFKQMVDRKLQAKGLTENLVREAFPGYLNERPEDKSLTPEE